MSSATASISASGSTATAVADAATPVPIFQRLAQHLVRPKLERDTRRYEQWVADWEIEKKCIDSLDASPPCRCGPRSEWGKWEPCHCLLYNKAVVRVPKEDRRLFDLSQDSLQDFRKWLKQTHQIETFVEYERPVSPNWHVPSSLLQSDPNADLLLVLQWDAAALRQRQWELGLAREQATLAKANSAGASAQVGASEDAKANELDWIPGYRAPSERQTAAEEVGMYADRLNAQVTRLATTTTRGEPSYGFRLTALDGSGDSVEVTYLRTESPLIMPMTSRDALMQFQARYYARTRSTVARTAQSTDVPQHTTHESS